MPLQVATNEPLAKESVDLFAGIKLALVAFTRMTKKAALNSAEPKPMAAAVGPIDDDVEIPDTAFRDTIPRLSDGEEYFIRDFAVVAWLYGFYWIVWRWSASLNHNAIIFSVVLLLAETYGLISSLLMIWTVW